MKATTVVFHQLQYFSFLLHRKEIQHTSFNWDGNFNQGFCFSRLVRHQLQQSHHTFKCITFILPHGLLASQEEQEINNTHTQKSRYLMLSCFHTQNWSQKPPIAVLPDNNRLKTFGNITYQQLKTYENFHKDRKIRKILKYLKMFLWSIWEVYYFTLLTVKFWYMAICIWSKVFRKMIQIVLLVAPWTIKSISTKKDIIWILLNVLVTVIFFSII